jgi:hypothetical protein
MIEDVFQEDNVNDGDIVWLAQGVTGAGKSCLGNFIFEGDNIFPESEIILESETQSASMKRTKISDRQLCYIDTPGLGDTQRLGAHQSKAMDIANDAAHLITELTKIMLMMRAGISSFLIVIPLNVREHSGTLNLLDFMDILGNYWKHSIAVLTHGKCLGRTGQLLEALHCCSDSWEVPWQDRGRAVCQVQTDAGSSKSEAY